MKIQFFGGHAINVHATRIEPFFVDSSGPHFFDQTIKQIYELQLKTHFRQIGTPQNIAMLMDEEKVPLIAVRDDIGKSFDPAVITLALENADRFGYTSVVMPIFRTYIPSEATNEETVTECMLNVIEAFGRTNPKNLQTVNIVLQPGVNYIAYHVLINHQVATLGDANSKGAFVRLAV